MSIFVFLFIAALRYSRLIQRLEYLMPPKLQCIENPAYDVLARSRTTVPNAGHLHIAVINGDQRQINAQHTNPYIGGIAIGVAIGIMAGYFSILGKAITTPVAPMAQTQSSNTGPFYPTSYYCQSETAQTNCPR